jgi:ribose transport system substrate-binding protein
MSQRKSARVAVMVGACLVAGMVTACGSDKDEGTGGGTRSVAVIMKDTTNPYFRAISAGALAEGRRLGYDAKETSARSEADIQGQIAAVEAAITRKVDGIVIAPDGPSLQPVLQRAVDRDIPVVLVDADIPGWGGRTALVGTDNVEAAAKAVVQMLGKIEGKPVFGLVGFEGSPPVAARIEGATKALTAAGTKPAQVVNGKADQQASQNAVGDMLKAHGDMNAVFACCSASSLGAVQAQRTSGVKSDNLLIYGFDGVPAEFDAIKAGTLDGTVSQRPKEMGRLGVDAVRRALDGQTVAKKVTAGYDIVTADNVDEFIGKQR